MDNNIKLPYVIGKPCILDPDVICNGCQDCLMCDLDPTKICDNCGKCLDSFNTDDKGFVKIKIDKIIRDGEEGSEENSVSLEDLYKQHPLELLNL